MVFYIVFVTHTTQEMQEKKQASLLRISKGLMNMVDVIINHKVYLISWVCILQILSQDFTWV